MCSAEKTFLHYFYIFVCLVNHITTCIHNPFLKSYFSSTVPPSIDEANLVFNPSVILGRSVLLECPVSGVPFPLVWWHRNNRNISVETSPRLRLMNDGQQLEINDVMIDDEARYSCVARNYAGEQRQNFDLAVLGKNRAGFRSPRLTSPCL